MPVIAIAPNDALIEKLKSNVQEVRARGDELYVIADAGAEMLEGEGVHMLNMPESYGPLSPALWVVPLQLLSYLAAFVKGTDVDKRRNMAMWPAGAAWEANGSTVSAAVGQATNSNDCCAAVSVILGTTPISRSLREPAIGLPLVKLAAQTALGDGYLDGLTAANCATQR